MIQEEAGDSRLMYNPSELWRELLIYYPPVKQGVFARYTRANATMIHDFYPAKLTCISPMDVTKDPKIMGKATVEFRLESFDILR